MPPKTLKLKYKLVDLFAGTGAFSHAFTQTGKVKAIWANDFADSSEEIYNLNHPDLKLTNADIHDIQPESIPKHDILCAGFNCQPFSIAGKQQGFNDERSNSFWKLAKILEHHKTPTIILENVKNLTSHDNGNTFKTIKEELDKLGYHYKYKVLNTCEVTPVPQNRERIYIVGFYQDPEKAKRFEFEFPDVTRDPISNYLESSFPDKKYYYTKSLKVFPIVEKDVTKHIRDNVVYQLRRQYVRENKSGVCPTLTANMGTGGHNVPLIKDDKGIRKLTPRECFNLQGFPNNYNLPQLSDAKLYSLAGNAVSVPVVQLIANKIVEMT
jgi:DNA (cytosine-5)-methyltransferase 1